MYKGLSLTLICGPYILTHNTFMLIQNKSSLIELSNDSTLFAISGGQLGCEPVHQTIHNYCVLGERIEFCEVGFNPYYFLSLFHTAPPFFIGSFCRSRLIKAT